MTDLTDATDDAVAVTGDFATGVKSASVTGNALTVLPDRNAGSSDYEISYVDIDEASGTIAFGGRDDFPTATVDLTKATVTINGGTPVALNTVAKSGATPSLVTDGNSGKKVLVVELDASFFSSNMTDLTDATADAVAVTGDFATDVAAANVTGNALTVLPDRNAGSSDYEISYVDIDEASGTIAFGGRADFPTATVDLTKATVTINGGTPVALNTVAKSGATPSLVTDGNSGKKVLVVELDASFFSSNMTDLTDATADAVAVTGDFATDVAAANVTGNALTVLPDRNAGSSDLVIDKVIFDEGAETFEIIPASGQFSGSPAYDFAAMTLSDGTTTLTFQSFLESGQSGGVQVNSGKLVFNINPSSIASLKTMLTTGDPDGVSIASNFSAGQNLVPVAATTIPIAVELAGSSINVKEVMFDAGHGSLELIVDGTTKFTGTPTVENFDWTKLSISIDGAPAPITSSDIDSIMVTTGGSFNGNLMIKLKASYDTTKLDGTNDTASIGADFVKVASGLTPVEAWTSPKSIMLFNTHEASYPKDSGEYTGSVFAALGTNTWESDSGITTAWNIDANYNSGLSNTVDGDDLNGLSYRQEQFLADIIEGVIVDELADIKYKSEPYDRIADNSEIKTSDHPVYILSDGSGGADDVMTFIENGMYVEFKGSLVANAQATSVGGSISAMSVFKAIQTDQNQPPVKDSSAQLEVTFTTAVNYADILNAVPDIT